MADAYLDHGAYASNLGAVPTWGVPQEGDGSATTPAAASSIASVAFASVPTSGTISVCGITISTTGVIGAASADAAANTLATNINATTTAVAAGVAVGLPQLRNLVYARGPSGGAPAGTCQIMMRVGSDTLNHASNSNVGIATTFSAAPTITQFVGGSGGCWGYLTNPAAIGVSNSIAAKGYGLLNSTVMVVGGGFAFGESDSTQVRTGRNLTLSMGTGITGTATRPTYVNLVFDDGTIWAGDAPSDKMTLEFTLNAGALVNFAYDNKFGSMRARQLGGLTIGLTLSGSGPVYWDYGAGSATSYGHAYEKVAFVERTNTGGSARLYFQGANYATRYSRAFIDCLLDFSASQRTNLLSPWLDLRNGTTSLIGNDIRFNLTGVGGAATTIEFAQATSGFAGTFVARGNKFTTGASGELKLLAAAGAVNAGATFILENNKGAGLPAGSIGLVTTSVVPNNAMVLLDNLGIGGSAKYEDRRGYAEFVLGQPVLSAIAPDGTPWSWLLAWTNATGVLNDGQPFTSPASRVQSRLADGARTYSVEMLVDSVTLANLPDFAWLDIDYINSSGDPVHDRMPVTLAASSATWSNVAAAPYNSWVARKITGTTAQSVKLNSVIQFRLTMVRPVPGASTASFCLDPEPALS